MYTPTSLGEHEFKLKAFADGEIICNPKVTVVENTSSGGTETVDLYCETNISNGTVLPNGKAVISCHNNYGWCVAAKIQCCPAGDCYNGSVDVWKVGTTSQTTSPRLGTPNIPCTDGGTSVEITSSGDLKCMVTN